MTKTNHLLLWLIMAIPLAAVGFPRTGAGGVGNTGDIAIQFEFAKLSAVQALKKVSHIRLREATKDDEVTELYRSCREGMYLEALQLSFEVVKEIPDAYGTHALARRTGYAEVEISKTEMDRLNKKEALSTSLLTALVLHETGHGCTYKGKAVDDSFDAQLNQLGTALFRLSHGVDSGSFSDIEFLEKVANGEKPGFSQLSGKTRATIAEKYVDYIGQWLYKTYQSSFLQPPAPAREYYANGNNSIFTGWFEVRSILRSPNHDLNYISYNLLRAIAESKDLFYYQGLERKKLPTQLECEKKLVRVNNIHYAECLLRIDWTPINNPTFSKYWQSIHFNLDVLGRVSFTSLDVRSR